MSYASSQLTVNTHTDASTSNNAVQEDFFDFKSEGEANGTENLTQPRDQLSVAVSGVTIECLQYLNEPCSSNLSTLNKYTNVNRLFRRLNAAVPSSAPVERLFSNGALITTPRRNRLADEHFEKLLLLNANKSFLL